MHFIFTKLVYSPSLIVFYSESKISGFWVKILGILDWGKQREKQKVVLDAKKVIKMYDLGKIYIGHKNKTFYRPLAIFSLKNPIF